jgi:hypothetical protein
MDMSRLVLRSCVLAVIFVCLSQVDSFAASISDETPALKLLGYALSGIALVVVIIAIFNSDLMTRILGRLGNSSGAERGPKPGEGSVIHDSSGEADFDGSSGRVPPGDTDRHITSRPKQST